MNVWLRNAQVLCTEENGKSLLCSADVGVQNEKILFVGAAPENFRPDRTIYCRGGLLMPGFVNAHTHSPLSLLRGCGEGKRLQQWLQQIVWPFEAKHTYESCYWGTMLNAAENIRCGVTCINDMYIHADAVAQAVSDAHLRALVCPTVTDALLSEQPDRFSRIAALAEQYRAHPYIHIGIAPHAVYTCSEQTLQKTYDCSERLQLPVHVHVAETRTEMENCARQTDGLTPLAVLEKQGLVHAHTFLAHGVYLTQKDITHLAERGACVVHCPKSNLKLGSGIAPVNTFLDAGACVALGTDSSASNNAQDLLEELRTAILLQRGARENPTLISVQQSIQMATYAPLKTMGFSDCGRIAPGMQADLILFDTKEPAWLPEERNLEALIFAAHATDVRMTMSAGRILYLDGAYFSIDMEKLRAQIKQILQKF